MSLHALWKLMPLATIDWDAVSALGTWAAVVVTGGGLYYASKQVDSWRTEHKKRKQAEIAEDLIKTAQKWNLLVGDMLAPDFIYGPPGQRSESSLNAFFSTMHAEINAIAPESRFRESQIRLQLKDERLLRIWSAIDSVKQRAYLCARKQASPPGSEEIREGNDLADALDTELFDLMRQLQDA